VTPATRPRELAIPPRPCIPGRMRTDWEARYQNNDTPWDKGEAAPPLREFLERASVDGRVLVPGSGTGHDVRLLAGHGADVLGLDIAPSGVEQARAFPAVNRERYRRGDFLALDDHLAGQFDWVFEHTCLCAIEPSDRPAYALAARRALKPGGALLAIFFKVVDDYDGSGPPHPINDDEIENLFGNDFITKDRWIPGQAYPSRRGKEEMRWLVRKEG